MLAAAASRSARSCGTRKVAVGRQICGSSFEALIEEEDELEVERPDSVARVWRATTSVCVEPRHREGSQLRKPAQQTRRA